MQKFQALDFLKTVSVLKAWSLIKLQNLNKYLTEKSYAPGNIIYKQGDESSVLYIIRKGSVSVETIVDIDVYNRYPVVIIYSLFILVEHLNLGNCKDYQESQVQN